MDRIQTERHGQPSPSSPGRGRGGRPVEAIARAQGGPSTGWAVGDILALQQLVGNRAVARLIEAAPADRALQRFAWGEDDPAGLEEVVATLRNWAYRNGCWPKFRRMSDWIERVRDRPAANAAVVAWGQFNQALADGNANLAKFRLTQAAGQLKTYVEATFEAALTGAERDEKDRLIDLLIQAIPPADVDAAARDEYKRALIAKVVGSPRYLQSIKGKNPYVENQQDDDNRTNGFNAVRIAARVDAVRAGGQLFADIVPGQAQAWQQWRGNDCVFAAILKVVLGGGAPTDEEADEAMATTLAGHLGVATGPVQDPVILRLMERLGWPHAGWPTWAAFQTRANPARTYVISCDTIASGAASHVVVATHNGAAWTIYDRQGVRLNRAIGAPPFANNPLDSWEVRDTEAAAAVREALN